MFLLSKIFCDVLIFILITFQKKSLFITFLKSLFVYYIRFHCIFKTPLFLAVEKNNKKIVELLINYNDTDINAKSIDRYKF